MSKYEELKDYVTKIQSEYQSEFEDLKNELIRTSPEDIGRLYEIVKQLNFCLNDLNVANRTSRALVEKEEEVRIKLNGFYDKGDRLMSFVYENVYKAKNAGRYKYHTANCRYFTTKKEAINYSISLGERENWLDYAYNFLDF